MKTIPQIEAQIQEMSAIIEKQGQHICQVLDVPIPPMPATAANTISRFEYETATGARSR